VVLTLAAGVAVAAVAVGLTSWDWLTCLLVTSPGGAPEMILVALALDHQVETVTASHLVRLIVINSSLPVWLWLTNKFGQSKFGQSSQRSTPEMIDLKFPHEV
jgi:uncharacterized membrane protein AbrB (regulator of aidB expression)